MRYRRVKTCQEIVELKPFLTYDSSKVANFRHHQATLYVPVRLKPTADFHNPYGISRLNFSEAMWFLEIYYKKNSV